MAYKAEYQGKMEAQLGEWGADIDKLKTKVDKVAAETRQSYLDQIEDLQTKHASVQAKLQELKISSDDAWGDLQQGLDHSLNQVKDTFSKAASRFKQ
jgi:GTP-binding protein EngB required for normal cell division